MSANPSSNYHEIEAELRKRIEGDIRFDHYSRLLYSTDASIYQIEPIGVVVPRHKGDVQAVIEIANKFAAPLLSVRLLTALIFIAMLTRVAADWTPDSRMTHYA